MPAPRVEDPRPLNAALVPLEQALIQRAAELEKAGEDGALSHVSNAIAAEFRALAQELHHWL